MTKLRTAMDQVDKDPTPIDDDFRLSLSQYLSGIENYLTELRLERAAIDRRISEASRCREVAEAGMLALAVDIKVDRTPDKAAPPPPLFPLIKEGLKPTIPIKSPEPMSEAIKKRMDEVTVAKLQHAQQAGAPLEPREGKAKK